MKNLKEACGGREDAALLVCCSGGVDSMVLLDLLVKARKKQAFRLGGIHVEHGLRAERSLSDADFVAGRCREKGLDFHLERLHLEAVTANIEETARKARYAAIQACLAARGYDYAVTGHNLDDQAETVIYRLVRGSGPRGMGAMDMRAGNIIRPLLTFSRRQIEDYASSNNISYVTDETNNDRRFARNLIRHEVMPLLQMLNPGCREAIGRFAHYTALENACLEEQAAELEKTAVVQDWCMVKVFDLDVLREAHPALARRFMIARLSAMLDDPRGIDAIQVEQLMEVLAGSRRAHVVRRRVRVAAGHGRLAFANDGPGPHYQLPVDGSGIYPLDSLGINLRLVAAGPAEIRSALPGDRLGDMKVGELLREMRVNSFLRPFWPVLEANGAVVALAGGAAAEGYEMEITDV